jgi:hypothetical protein
MDKAKKRKLQNTYTGLQMNASGRPFYNSPFRIATGAIDDIEKDVDAGMNIEDAIRIRWLEGPWLDAMLKTARDLT